MINGLFAALILVPPVIWVAALGFVTLLGQVFGCEINEVSAPGCIVLGLELAGTAYNAGILATWGPLILFPFAIAALLSFAVVALLRALLRKARSAPKLPPAADLRHTAPTAL